jgi:hypothetical protein
MNVKEIGQRLKGDFIFSPLRVILYILMMTFGAFVEIGILQSVTVVGAEYPLILLGFFSIVLLGLIEFILFFWKRADELSSPFVIFI